MNREVYRVVPATPPLFRNQYECLEVVFSMIHAKSNWHIERSIAHRITFHMTVTTRTEWIWKRVLYMHIFLIELQSEYIITSTCILRCICSFYLQTFFYDRINLCGRLRKPYKLIILFINYENDIFNSFINAETVSRKIVTNKYE